MELLLLCPQPRPLILSLSLSPPPPFRTFLRGRLQHGRPAKRGVFHGAEVRFVFFASSFLVGWDEKDLSLDMNRYWSNLAASGNVNFRTSREHEDGLGTNWPEYTLETKETLHFEARNIVVETELHVEECAFWDTLP
jgi:carboxylesterase type B